VIGESCELGDKVTVKQSCIGKGCQIGAKSKLNNCVVMDYAIIGERYVHFISSFLLLSVYMYALPLLVCSFRLISSDMVLH
jgi:NDP-sugar pyrophosphorylase family protein